MNVHSVAGTRRNIHNPSSQVGPYQDEGVLCKHHVIAVDRVAIRNSIFTTYNDNKRLLYGKTLLHKCYRSILKYRTLLQFGNTAVDQYCPLLTDNYA